MEASRLSLFFLLPILLSLSCAVFAVEGINDDSSPQGDQMPSIPRYPGNLPMPVLGECRRIVVRSRDGDEIMELTVCRAPPMPPRPRPPVHLPPCPCNCNRTEDGEESLLHPRMPIPCRPTACFCPIEPGPNFSGETPEPEPSQDPCPCNCGGVTEAESATNCAPVICNCPIELDSIV